MKVKSGLLYINRNKTDKYTMRKIFKRLILSLAESFRAILLSAKQH